MEYQKGHPWIPNKNDWKFISRTWIIINVKQHLWSTCFGSSIFTEGEIDHSTVVQRQTRLGWNNRWEVILWVVEVEKCLGGNGEYQYTKMLQTNWLRPDCRIHLTFAFQMQVKLDMVREATWWWSMKMKMFTAASSLGSQE